MYSAENHTVRVTTDAAVTIPGCIAPMPNPPLIVWLKAAPTIEGGATQGARIALYLAECASIVSGYPNVIPVDPGSGWDTATMLYHDYGHGFVVHRVQPELLETDFTRGLNSITGVSAGNYVSPAAAYTSGTATAPSQLTGFTATTGNQFAFAWTRLADGGATLTGYTIASSPAGTGTWTTAATTLPGDTTAVVTSGFTATASYDFRIKVTKGVGTSTPSATSTATAGAAPTTSPSHVHPRRQPGLDGCHRNRRLRVDRRERCCGHPVHRRQPGRRRPARRRRRHEPARGSWTTRRFRPVCRG